MLYQLFINQLFILFHVFLALEVGEAFRRSVYDPAWRRLRLGPIKISEPPHVPNLAACKKSTIQDARFCYSNESNECLYDHMPSLHFQSVFNVPWSAHWNCGTILNQQGLSGSSWKPPKKRRKDQPAVCPMYLYVPSAKVAGTMLIQQLPKLVHQQSSDLRSEMIGPFEVGEIWWLIQHGWIRKMVFS